MQDQIVFCKLKKSVAHYKYIVNTGVMFIVPYASRRIDTARLLQKYAEEELVLETAKRLFAYVACVGSA
jgi:hypothetical protein